MSSKPSVPQRWPGTTGPICRVAWVLVACAVVTMVVLWRGQVMEGWGAGLLFAAYASLALAIRRRPWAWIAVVAVWGFAYPWWSMVVIRASVDLLKGVLSPFDSRLSAILAAAVCGGLTALLLWRATGSRTLALRTLAASAVLGVLLAGPFLGMGFRDRPAGRSFLASPFGSGAIGAWHLYVSGALLWWAAHGKGLSQCGSCGYDRTGLAPGSICPECGEGAAAAP
jgi:hypothetical protein